ncbi:MAG: peptidoglycan editing factor PgeF [Eubacteriales bacterium]|nr:peptidoglycan editing factor PgeF [Eubacteriales bacterium]
MDWIYANQNHSTLENQKDGVVYLTFPKLVKAGVVHGFSTRMGGVSKGCLGEMNLSFTRGDEEENVKENFRRIGEAIGFSSKDLVLSSQVHGTKIRKVGAGNRGEGIVRESVPGVDGLVTNEKNVPMYTSYADCVPLIFYDPVKKVAALAHSGWRGTAGRIGAKMVACMEKDYGCFPRDIIAAIGPSICQDCYEVSEDVVEAFSHVFSEEALKIVAKPGKPGKYQLDLWKANEIILREAGILPEHLDVTDLCTCCNHDKLFSHRASHGKRGNMGCFIMLT